MLRCTHCEGFIPAELTCCPNCTKLVPRGRVGRKVLAALSAGAAAITLMACYGMPPCDDRNPDCRGNTDAGVTDGGVSDAGQTCADGGTVKADGGC